MQYLTHKKKASPKTFQQMKEKGEKIAMLTAYDYSFAHLINEVSIDILLVGDSASNTMQGNASTLPITLDEMITYARSVVKGSPDTYVVSDLPFGSYQVSKEEAVKNAIRLVKETGCDAVKLEGGKAYTEEIKAIIRSGIPVMGHLGLMPQSVNIYGGYGLRAKEEKEIEQLFQDAKLLEELGCFSIVLEKIPASVAQELTLSLSIPTIGIGAGKHTDGQVLVLQDMLGITEGFSPKFLRKYAQLNSVIKNALTQYSQDVKTGSFPNGQEQY